MAEFAYNATLHHSAQMSPFETYMGYVPQMPLGTIAGDARGRDKSRGARVTKEIAAAIDRTWKYDPPPLRQLDKVCREEEEA